jgi:hypothetical protein
MALATTPISGEKEIKTTNKAEKVVETSTVLTGVSVKAKKGNAAVVNIGPETVSAKSYELEGGESLEFYVVDLARVWVFGKEKDIVKFFGLEP